MKEGLRLLGTLFIFVIICFKREELCNTIIITISEGETLYASMGNHKLVLHYNLNNLIAFLGKVFLYIEFTIVSRSQMHILLSHSAFKVQCHGLRIQQLGIQTLTCNKKLLNHINRLAGSGPFYEQWKFFFYAALGLSVIYMILCIPGIRHAK